MAMACPARRKEAEFRMQINHPPEPAPLPQVLIIDDDLEFCALIQEYLSGCGYQVAAAHTGPDGVTMVAAGTWHAVILDVI